MEQDFVFSFPKNEKEEVRFSLREYKDHLYLDIRVFFQTDDGGWKPTKKGITFSAGNYADFKKGVGKMGEQVSVLGKAA